MFWMHQDYVIVFVSRPKERSDLFRKQNQGGDEASAAVKMNGKLV